MSVFFSTAVPFFAVIWLGWILARRDFIGDSGIEALNRFAYFVALPALFVAQLSQTPFTELLDGHYALAYAGASTAVFALAAIIALGLLRLSLAEGAVFSLSCAFANVGYLGLPLVLSLYGPAAAAPAALSIMLDSTLLMAMASAMASIAGEGGLIAALGRVARGVARNPMILGSAVGLALSAAQTPLPTPVANFCAILGPAAAPCALFALGASVHRASRGARAFREAAVELSAIAVLKLAAHPLLAFAAFSLLPGIDPLWAACGLIMASTPTAATAYVFASSINAYPARASSAVVVTTALAVLTMTLALLHALPPASP